jgi:uncharacterized protein
MGTADIEPESMQEAQFNPAAQLRPASFSHPVANLRIRETGLSWVILTGRYAYKIKKSVCHSFVDQSSLEQRKALCEEELRLNRRLASDLYEELVPITSDADGIKIDGAGAVVEYAVKMKEFPASHELSALLERSAVEPAAIRSLGARLADFHQSLPKACAASNFAGTQDMHRAVLGTLATILCRLESDMCSSEVGGLVDWIHDFLRDAQLVFHERERDGHIRECHGDLHARNVVLWGEQLIPFDSLEFDPKLRWIDTMNDVAFLFMDLVSHDRSDLAFDFLNAYVARSGDYEGLRLLRFYAVYRALVRTMVDLLAVEDQPGESDAYRRHAQVRLTTATRFLDAPVPGMILMHGLSGSGKSWLSAQLAEHLGAVQVRSDVERRRLRDGPELTDIHTAAFNQRTYARLLACAQSCLEGGITAIVDAAFLDAVNRREFRAWADAGGFPFLVIACQANVPELETRIIRRRNLGLDPSDADLGELHRQISEWVPLDFDESPRVIEIDTTSNAAVPEALQRIRAKFAEDAQRRADSS